MPDFCLLLWRERLLQQFSGPMLADSRSCAFVLCKLLDDGDRLSDVGSLLRVACARLLGIYGAPAARLLEACSARRRQLCALCVELVDVFCFRCIFVVSCLKFFCIFRIGICKELRIYKE